MNDLAKDRCNFSYYVTMGCWVGMEVILTLSQYKLFLKLQFHIEKKDGEHDNQMFPEREKLICHKIIFAKFVFSSPKRKKSLCVFVFACE